VTYTIWLFFFLTFLWEVHTNPLLIRRFGLAVGFIFFEKFCKMLHSKDSGVLTESAG